MVLARWLRVEQRVRGCTRAAISAADAPTTPSPSPPPTPTPTQTPAPGSWLLGPGPATATAATTATTTTTTQTFEPPMFHYALGCVGFSKPSLGIPTVDAH